MSLSCYTTFTEKQVNTIASLVLEEFRILRAKRAATKDKMNKIMAAITKFNTFTEETPVLMQMLSEELKTVTQSRKQDKQVFV
jgi:hypothetical protein